MAKALAAAATGVTSLTQLTPGVRVFGSRRGYHLAQVTDSQLQLFRWDGSDVQLTPPFANVSSIGAFTATTAGETLWLSTSDGPRSFARTDAGAILWARLG